MHADKEPEPLNLGVPVGNFPRANAILARAQALLWVRDCTHAEEREVALTGHRSKVNLPTSVPVSSELWDRAGAKKDSIFHCVIHLY